MAVLGNNYTTTNPPKTSDGRRAFGTGNFKIYNSNSAFTVPDGITEAKVHVYGAGGGGALAGGGGAGGGYGSCVLTVTPGCVCNISIGIGGTGGTNSSFVAANGTLSCFGSVIGCGGQGGCSVVCNLSCSIVPAANGGGAVGVTCYKGGNGGICVNSGGAGAGSPIGIGGCGSDVIQGGGGGTAGNRGCIGGGGTGGPGGTILGGADLCGSLRLSSGNLYDRDVIGRYPGDIISGGGGGCQLGTGGIGGGAGGVGPNAGICPGMIGGYFGGGSGGIKCGGNGGIAGGGGGSGYGTCGTISFAHGTGLMFKSFATPSVFQSLVGANTVGVGFTNTSLCIMGAGCFCTSANNLALWTACTPGDYYYCNYWCHTVTSALSDRYMKDLTGIGTAQCIIHNNSSLCYIYLDACAVICAGCPANYCTSPATSLRMQIVCLTSNSTNPAVGANICGAPTTPFCTIHTFSAAGSGCGNLTHDNLSCHNGIINWAHIPCKSQILVYDGVEALTCVICCPGTWAVYNINANGATSAGSFRTCGTTQIVTMASVNTYSTTVGCNGCAVFLCCGGTLTTGNMDSCLYACNLSYLGYKHRCSFYVPNCTTANSFVYTGHAQGACHSGVGTFGYRGVYIISMFENATRICQPFGVACTNNAQSSVLINARCQIGCIPDTCPDVYYVSSDSNCFHTTHYGCKMYGLTTDPTCWCYNQATCWSCNNIHPATLSYWPQANLFIAFSSNTDSYAYSNTLEGNWTFGTHCAVKCVGSCYWGHAVVCGVGLTNSTLHPHKNMRTPPIAIANNRIAIKYFNCDAGACCTGILVSNNITNAACWVNVTCAAQAGWCNIISASAGSWCNIHYVPYLDRIIALHGCCIHVSSLSNEAVTFTSCNISNIAGNTWCAFASIGWQETTFLYNKYSNITQTCRILPERERPGLTNSAIRGRGMNLATDLCGLICYSANNVAVVAASGTCCVIGIAMSCNGTTWATYLGCVGGSNFPANCGFVSTGEALNIKCNLQVVGSANNTIVAGVCCNASSIYLHFDGSTLCPYVTCLSFGGGTSASGSMPCTSLIYYNNTFLAYSRYTLCDSCFNGVWTSTPRVTTWASPSFFTSAIPNGAGTKSIICTLNSNNQTCFTYIMTGCGSTCAHISKSADMCTWTPITSIIRPYGSYLSTFEGTIHDSHHYDPCYDLFFWAYAPSALVAINGDMTSICRTLQQGNSFLPAYHCNNCVSAGTAALCNAQTGVLNEYSIGINCAPISCTKPATLRCVFNICSTHGVGGQACGGAIINMIPKCDFTNVTNPVYCFCDNPGPLLVVGYCTSTKCFTMCNYPAGWKDVPYCGTYSGNTNYIGTGACGGNGLVVVEY